MLSLNRVNKQKSGNMKNAQHQSAHWNVVRTVRFLSFPRPIIYGFYTFSIDILHFSSLHVCACFLFARLQLFIFSHLDEFQWSYIHKAWMYIRIKDSRNHKMLDKLITSCRHFFFLSPFLSLYLSISFNPCGKMCGNFILSCQLWTRLN